EEEEEEDVIIVRVERPAQNEKEVEIVPPPKEDEETDDICQICWRDINLFTSCELSCKHGPFHYCCIKKWAIKEKKPCPTCRRKIDKAYLKIGSKTKEIHIEIPKRRLRLVSFQEFARRERDNKILYSEERISQDADESEAKKREMIRIFENENFEDPFYKTGLTLNGVYVPRDILDSVFKFVPKKQNDLNNIGRVCKTFWVLLCMNYNEVLVITPNNMRAIPPIIVSRATKFTFTGRQKNWTGLKRYLADQTRTFLRLMNKNATHLRFLD
ncbi:unnamed protein product, partial [marine sediment metagenome]